MRSRKLALSLFVSALAFTAAPAFAEEAQPQAGPSFPLGQLPAQFAPAGYRIDLTIDPSKERFSGHVEIDGTMVPTRTLYLHGRDLAMRNVTATAGGTVFRPEWKQLDETGVASLTFPEALTEGPVTLAFDYEGAFNNGPAALFHTKVGEDWFAWTQFQSIDARGVFPSFDEPGIKVPFDVTLRTPEGLVAVSNAPEVSRSNEGGLEVHRFARTQPLPTYLLAFMVGPFKVAEGSIPATPQRAGALPQRIVATPGEAGFSRFPLDATAEIVPLLERYFDIPYPYAKLDQITSPIMPGAMENAGAILYQDRIIMLDEDASTARKRLAGMVMAHEIGHQWFGDLVTPVWWNDIWLNESFANWVGYYIADQWRPELRVWEGALGEGFEAMDTDALVAGRAIRTPILRNDQIDAAFDTITYGKGSHVIAMIAAFMGEEKFRDGVRAHLKGHLYGNATGEDFFAALARAAGDPRLVDAMKGFVEQQGVPLVTVTGADGNYTVTQQRYARLGSVAPATTWLVPLCMRRGDRRECKLLDDNPGQFTLGGDGPLLPNAGGNGYYRFELPAAEWDALIDRADTLKGGEAQAVADSLRASFLAGRATPEQLIALTRKLAVNPDSWAFAEAGATLGLLDEGDLLTGEAEGAYKDLVDRIYLPQLHAIGFNPARGAYSGADPEAVERREKLVARLAFAAEDAGVRAKLAAAAEAYLGGEERALDPAFLGEALDVYIAEGGIERVKALAEKALSSHDPEFRPIALAALGETGDPVAADWLLNGLKDSRLRPTERLALLRSVIGHKETREFGADWLRANYRALLDSMGGIFVASSIPGMLGGFCSADRADQFANDFGELFRNSPGELGFARTLEKVRACDALTSARGEAMRAAVLAAE